MFRSRIFWKLLLAFASLNLLAVVLLLSITTSWLQAGAVRDAESRLNAATLLLVEVFASRFDEEPATLSKRLSRIASDAGMRYSLLSLDGTVLATTDRVGSPQAGKNAAALPQKEANRPEVTAALSSGAGFLTRPDDGIETAFFARRVDRQAAAVGVVRASLPIAAIQERVAALRRRYVYFGLGLGVAMLGVIYAIARHIVTPVAILGRAADAIAAGDYRHRTFIPNKDELGSLAKSFNRMGLELDAEVTELRENAQRQATVLGGMVEGVIAIDERQRVLFANAAAGRLFGFLPLQAEDRPLLEVVRHHALSDAVAAALNSGRPQRLEVEWEGDETLLLSTQVTPLPGDPCPGAIVVLHDTTELRRLESVRREFVANVSHELKTPLSSIKAYAETLLNGAIHDEKHSTHFLRRIEEQADRLNNLIQDMLSLARIESDRQPFAITRVTVADIAQECVEDYLGNAAAKQIALTIEPGTPNATVKADPEGLRVILNNLVDNAIKYTPNGGRVTLSWRHSTEGSLQNPRQAEQLHLEVADNGVGIPESEVPRVFERFYRVDKARSRDVGGTGLGLSIVKHLVQSFGGAVSVDSIPGEGTTFRIELPC